MDFSIENAINEIRKGESIHTEFKTGLSQLKPAMKTLCAFLNNTGGKLFLGVKDNGDLVGLQVSDKTKREIADHLVKFEPHADVHVHYLPIPGRKDFIVVLRAVPHDQAKPYCYEGTPYYREESTTRQMPQPMYQKLLHLRSPGLRPWDEETAEEFYVSTIDISVFKKYVDLAVKKGRISNQFSLLTDTTDILMRLGLMRGEEIVNAAVVLFGQKFLPEYPQCCLKLANFRSDNKRESIDSVQMHDNFFNLLDAAESFIKKHSNITSYFVPTSMERQDIPDYPSDAIREILVNAFAHRNYSSSSGYVSVELYPDRLEVASFGRLPEEITIEMLTKKHRSVPPNKLIADMLHSSGYIEIFGTGTQEICRVCRNLHKPEPLFLEKGGFFVVTLYKSYEQLMQKEYQHLSLRQQAILSVVAGSHDGLSNQEIINLLKLDISNKTLTRDLRILEEARLLVAIGATKSRRWSASLKAGIRDMTRDN